ncbi:FCS-Like Zinc finger 10 isoform X1 [Coffea arabica]|uniref:FCS-Like Zinc finger 10 isoform X1 n=1 Tax=Coffea arabica TaxID=13443 RepID=A0A6P6U1H7_COFAR|nr:FCS-Like Zinc finger 10-like [Coffea arabica]
MLRKRTRSHQKDQNMGQLNSDVVSESFVHSDFLAHRNKNSSFFNVPGLFVGFNSKNSESDSARSPTSPLDFRVFSTWGNPFRSPKLSHESHHQKTWDTNKVGLSIIDSLDYEVKQSGKVLRSSDSKNILFGPKIRIKTPNFNNCTDSFEAPKSLPKDVGIFPFAKSKLSNLQNGSSDVLFEIGDGPLQRNSLGNFRPCSLDSGRSGSHLSRLANHNSNLSSTNFSSSNGTGPATSPSHFKIGSVLGDSSGAEQPSITATIANGLIGTISPSEIELSEDYTCVRKHGPNPKVTHIFGDCVLECRNSELSNFGKYKEEGNALPLTAECSEVPTSYPSSDFLSFCYSCKKKLDGEDIYMYRGEKAFCSWACRLEEIMIDEETEKCNKNVSEKSSKPSNSEELSETGLFIST